MNEKEALEIAKIAYEEIQTVIEKWESKGLCVHWDECISIDEFFFQRDELREK